MKHYFNKNTITPELLYEPPLFLDEPHIYFFVMPNSG